MLPGTRVGRPAEFVKTDGVGAQLLDPAHKFDDAGGVSESAIQGQGGRNLSDRWSAPGLRAGDRPSGTKDLTHPLPPTPPPA